MTNYLIKGARPYGGDPADILIKNGRIATIGESLTATGVDHLGAAGLIALPGLVDLHTHLREPGREDAETVETGSRAAALGGFTAVHAMANTDPVASITSAPVAVSDSPIVAIRPFLIRMSAGSPP